MYLDAWLAAVKAKTVDAKPGKVATYCGVPTTIDPADALIVANKLGGILPTIEEAAAMDVPCCCALNADREPVAVWRNDAGVAISGTEVREQHGINFFRGEHVRLVLSAEVPQKAAPKAKPKPAPQPEKKPEPAPAKASDPEPPAPKSKTRTKVRPKPKKKR